MSSSLYALSGLLVGFLVGLTGVGGGSLMTPLLILLFSVHPTTAVGSDLLYASATKTVGAVVHGRHGSVDWRITGLLACGSVPAAMLTLVALAQWPQTNPQSHLVSLALAVVLLITSALLVFRNAVLALFAKSLARLRPAQITGLTVATGVLLGCLVTVSSVGAGAIGMTALLMLYPRLPAVRLVGSDIAHAIPLTLLAGAGHWALGDVNFGLVASLLVGSIPGIIVGSLLSFRLPEGALRIGLAAVLFTVSMTLLK